jgi:hypothetical protein
MDDWRCLKDFLPFDFIVEGFCVVEEVGDLLEGKIWDD